MTRSPSLRRFPKRTPAVIIDNNSVIVTGTSLLNAFDRLEVLDYSAEAIIAARDIGPVVHHLGQRGRGDQPRRSGSRIDCKLSIKPIKPIVLMGYMWYDPFNGRGRTGGKSHDRKAESDADALSPEACPGLERPLPDRAKREGCAVPVAGFREGYDLPVFHTAEPKSKGWIAMPDQKYRFETIQVHAGQETPDPTTDARAVPIYATTSYVFKDSAQAAGRFALTEGGNIYTRLMNPTSSVFEARIAALEGGAAALATASGSSAITYAVQNIATAGDHIVSAANLYGGTLNLFSNTLREQGLSVTYVDPFDPANFEKAILPNTKLLFAETLGNPNSDVIDLRAISDIAHKHGIPFVVDSTFATPYLLRPIEYGVDIVVHSATKFIGGHGTVMGGVIVDAGKFDWAASDKFPGLSKPNPSYHGVVFTDAVGPIAYIIKARTTLMRDQGAAISPFNSFLLLQGLETLSLRVERHVENALKVVEFLNNHPQVERVNHPSLLAGRQKELYDQYFPNGAASIFTFEIKGGAKEAQKFTESLKLFSLLANVADVKSLVIHPASTTHSQLSEKELLAAGIKPNTVRLSIGTEHIDDILFDLAQGFDAVK